MITEIFKTLTAGVSEKKSIVLANNGGIIIMDVDESKFTSEMKKQLDHVDFNFYLNDSTSEPKRLLLSTKSWRSHEDRAIAFNEVPAASFVEVVVVLDESYITANNVIPIQEFPIKVSISDENILKKSGGGGDVDPTLIDNKISAHNTSPTAHEDIRQLVSKAVKYKGSVKNYSDLPANPADGDMYNIENADTEHQINAGDNVVWIADTQIWDNLGGFIDLSQLQVMMDFPAWLSVITDDPTKTMNDVVSVLDANVTTTGLIYMGGLSVSDLPESGMVQAETTIEVMKSSNGDPLYKFTLISTNVPPYMWTATGYNNVFDGWQARPTEEDLVDYVKFTDYATQDKGGVVKVHPGYGLKMGELGTLMINKANQEMIDGRINENNPIVPANLDYAVRSVLPEVQTSLPETIIKNCIYDLGEQTTLSITLPATGNVGDWLQFDFMSNTIATTLSVTSTAGILGYDLIPEVSTIYSLYCDWGIIGREDTGEMKYGWRFSYSEYPLSV